MDADKSILERGKLKPVQDLCGRWEIVDSEDDTYEVIHGRLPVKENRYLTKEQTQEVCNIVNYFKDKRNGFLETLRHSRHGRCDEGCDSERVPCRNRPPAHSH